MFPSPRKTVLVTAAALLLAGAVSVPAFASQPRTPEERCQAAIAVQVQAQTAKDDAARKLEAAKDADRVARKALADAEDAVTAAETANDAAKRALEEALATESKLDDVLARAAVEKTKTALEKARAALVTAKKAYHDGRTKQRLQRAQGLFDQASGILVRAKVTVGRACTPPPTTSPDPKPDAFVNCDEVRAAGAAPILASHPRFQASLDADSDGVGCELVEGDNDNDGDDGNVVVDNDTTIINQAPKPDTVVADLPVTG